MAFTSVSYDDEAERRMRGEIRGILAELQVVCWSYTEQTEQNQIFFNTYKRLQSGVFDILSEKSFELRRKKMVELGQDIADLKRVVNAQDEAAQSTESKAPDVEELDTAMQTLSNYEDWVEAIEARDFDRILTDSDSFAQENAYDPILHIVRRLVAFQRLGDMCEEVARLFANLPPYLNYDQRHVALLKKELAEMKTLYDKAKKSESEMRSQLTQEKRQVRENDAQIKSLEQANTKLKGENTQLQARVKELEEDLEGRKKCEQAQELINRGTKMRDDYMKVSQCVAEILKLSQVSPH